MLELKHIVKKYLSGDQEVVALNDVSLRFRESEFVSILGASGCGKTTMLNIVGGLDRYTSGDLTINGKSTKEFKDGDWDTYRNHSVGFVFQSYNLIPHQSVLSNVELALTLSGVSKSERRAKAVAALNKVGLGDQLHKRPNQMSGGQMQRVAIARALVNDPDILLADEPTGALDTQTSEQIMDLLKEVAENRLVVMVTHNPELAEAYSTRIIRLRDGQVVDDSLPVEEAEYQSLCANQREKNRKREEELRSLGRRAVKKAKKKTSMSFATALSLSLNNLMTKKGRTILTSFAGSIGIIGIALILSLSNGVNLFIDSVQEETLTSYPISIAAQTSDYSAMMAAMVGSGGEGKENRDPSKIYVDDSISDMVQAMVSMDQNNLSAFNKYFESRRDEFTNDILAVQYRYDMDLQIYNANSPYGDKGLVQVSPSDILSDFSDEYGGLSMITDSISIFSEIMPGRNGEIINDSVYSQYDLVDGRWPTAANEIVLVVNKNNSVSNITLYMLGMLDPDEMSAMMASMMVGEDYEANTEGMEFSFQDFYDLDLFLAYNSDFYEKTDKTYDVSGTSLPLWSDKRDGEGFEAGALRENGMDLKIVGVICPNEDAAATSISGSIGYTSHLTSAVLAKINESELVKQQIGYPTHDVFSGLRFEIEDANTLTDAQKIEKLEGYFGSLNAKEKGEAYLGIRTEVTEAEMKEYLAKIKEVINTPEKQKQFLIDLYGFNSKNGSLELGTSANEAVAAILLATDMLSDEALTQMGVTDLNNREQVLSAYKNLVPSFGTMFQLDGIPVTPEDNPKVYETYHGLLTTMYNTEEKMSRAFDSMTEMTFRSVYAMVETQNLTNEAKAPTAPHFAAFLANTDLTVAEKKQELQTYVLTSLFTANGITDPQSPLGQALTAYVYGSFDPATMTMVGGMSDEELKTQYYLLRLEADEAFKEDAIGALFDAYREDMRTNHSAEYASLYANHMQKSESTYDENLVAVGSSLSPDSLTAINIYPVDFEAKERLTQIITDYNNQPDLAEEDQISYTDMMAIMMSSVTIIINAITYVLVAFVSISLVVSSIMIGIITYISVLERTKEIGILRSIGASKKDISRVFNAETLIVGFCAGAIGILATVLLCFPINAIIQALSNMNNIRASLPLIAGIALILISMLLTFVAGLIPSRLASKKDPVEALRTE